MAEENESNFTFRMPDSLRDVVTAIASAEDRSLSKIAVYLMWTGIAAYVRTHRLVNAYEAGEFAKNKKILIEKIGKTQRDVASQDVPILNVLEDDEDTKRKRA